MNKRDKDVYVGEGLYVRGKIYWYAFQFGGARVRESAHTTSKTIARRAKNKRLNELAEGINGLRKRVLPPLFSIAADRWLESKTKLTPRGKSYYSYYVSRLKRRFANSLVSDITAADIAALQRKRQGESPFGRGEKKLSGRHINCEIATLRAILRYHGLWALIAPHVKMLPERTDTGLALSAVEEAELLEAIGHSPSPSLYPFFVLSLDAGLRPSETRALRRRDLNLVWQDGVISEGEIVVGQSKTEAGRGRVVPLTKRACAALSLWLSRFPDAGSDAYAFPSHHVGFAGDKRIAHLWGVDLSRPMSTYSYKTAWNTARDTAKVACRFYDARHSFITRLAENPAVSEETIRQLAGHVNPRMLSRYAHVRAQARRDAIATLEIPPATERANFEAGSPQKSPHSVTEEKPVLN